MTLETVTLLDLCNDGLVKTSRIKGINDEIENLENQIKTLRDERAVLIFAKKDISTELVRRKCHDIGGALTLIQTGEIAGDSTEIFDRERNKIKKVL